MEVTNPILQSILTVGAQLSATLHARVAAAPHAAHDRRTIGAGLRWSALVGAGRRWSGAIVAAAAILSCANNARGIKRLDLSRRSSMIRPVRVGAAGLVCCADLYWAHWGGAIRRE